MDTPKPAEHYTDDPSIADDDFVIRRIRPGAVEWSGGAPVSVQKAAFQDQTLDYAVSLGFPARCLSVSLQSTLMQSNLDPVSYLLAGWHGYGLQRVSVGLLREAGQGVMRFPTADDLSHAVVFATGADATQRSKSCQKAARDAAEWICFPRPVS